jgi:hypothetical protein
MAGITITTENDLPGPEGDEPYLLFMKQTEYGNARFLRSTMLSARPVFLEAPGLEPALTLMGSDIHLQMEGYPVEQGAWGGTSGAWCW